MGSTEISFFSAAAFLFFFVVSGALENHRELSTNKTRRLVQYDRDLFEGSFKRDFLCLNDSLKSA